MPNEINFLSSHRKKLTAKQKRDKKLMRSMLYVLSVALTISLLVVGIMYYFSNSLKEIKKNQEQVKAIILNNEDVEKSFSITAEKLLLLLELNKKRQNKQEAIKFFSNIFGNDVMVTQIQYDDNEQTLSFDLKSNDVFVLEKVFNTLSSEAVKTGFQGVKKNNLRRNDDGSYQLKIGITLGSTNIIQLINPS